MMMTEGGKDVAQYIISYIYIDIYLCACVPQRVLDISCLDSLSFPHLFRSAT